MWSEGLRWVIGKAKNGVDEVQLSEEMLAERGDTLWHSSFLKSKQYKIWNL